MPHTIVPDYIIFDELKKRREKVAEPERPRLEMPRYSPLHPEQYGEQGTSTETHSDEQSDRGEVIIPMW